MEALASKMEGTTLLGPRPMLAIEKPRITIGRSAGQKPLGGIERKTYRFADHTTTGDR